MKKEWYFAKLTTLLFTGLILIEFVFHFITFHTIFEKSILRIILFTLVASIFLGFLLSLMKPKYSKIGLFFILFVSSIYTVAQLGFFNFMGNYMSLNATGDGAGRVGDYVLEFIRYIKPTYYLCFLPLFLLILLFFFKKEFLKWEKWNIKKGVILVCLVLLLHVFSLATLEIKWFQNNNQIKSNKELYKNPTLIELSLRQFGTNRFLWRDIISIIFPTNIEAPIIDIENPPVIEKPSNNRLIDDTIWEEKMKNESDPTIKNLDQFFLSQTVLPKNEMTGIFKDKNLILIMVEAFDLAAINQDVTPTLYKLANEGWYFDNYYTPKYSCTTGESEFIALTSIIPSSSVCTPNTYRNNNYSRSLFQIFNQANYNTTSYHNWHDEFYERKIIHKNMGSSFFYDHDDLAISPVYGWPSDLELIQKASTHFIGQEKFMSFIITSSMHFPYDIDSTITNKNWNTVKNLSYSTSLKRYLAKANELDQGLNFLLKELEEKNILDDTVIAIFGDHHPLKMNLSDLNSASPINRFEDFNEDRLPFIIYNHGSEAKTISKTASTFDILPTLANLFDLNFDSRSYVGTDIFSEDETTVIFTSGSWITDQAMYFSSSGKYKALAENLEEDYILKTNQKVKNYFNISDQILKKNYWNLR